MSTVAHRAIIWARRNLFRTWLDGVVTVIVGSMSLYAGFRLLRYVFVTGRWDIVRVNLDRFIVGSWDDGDLWRPVTALVVFAALGGLLSGTIHRRQTISAASAGRAMPSTAARLRSVLDRFWPAAIGVLVLLLLARTATPWLVVASAIAAMVAGRLVGATLPPKSTVPLLAVTVAVSVAMVWFLAQANGWDAWGGLMLNVFLAVVSISLCFPLGVALALGRRSQLPVIRWLSTAYIELFRGVPLLVLLLMANIALGFFIPQSLAPGKVVRAIVVFTLFTAAYVAEIVRGGLQSVPRGQVEAGRAMGLSPVKVTALIVLPQALRNVIPALVGQFITLFKDTTLAGAAMGFIDLLAGAEASTAQDAFRGQALYPEAITFVTMLFWIGSYTMSRESQRLEQKLGVGER